MVCKDNQYIKIKSLKIDLQIHGKLLFRQGTKPIQWREGTLFFNKWCWVN